MIETINHAQEIFVFDEDSEACADLREAFNGSGLDLVFCIERSELSRAVRESAPACIILDVKLPEKPGLQILKEDLCYGSAPVLLVSKHADIAMAVDGIRLGAADLIRKPFKKTEIVKNVRSAIDSFGVRTTRPFTEPNASPLERQSEILKMIVSGLANDDIARRLNVGARAVEEHRREMMKKLQPNDMIDLLRTVLLRRF